MKKIFAVMVAVLVVLSLCGNVFAVGSETNNGDPNEPLDIGKIYSDNSLQQFAEWLEGLQLHVESLGSLKNYSNFYLPSYELWCKWNDDPNSEIALLDTMGPKSVIYIPDFPIGYGVPKNSSYAAISMETKDYWFHFCYDKDFGATVLEQAKALSDVSMLVNGHPVYSYCEPVELHMLNVTSYNSRGYYWEQNGYVMKIITIGKEEPDDDMFAKCNAVFYTIPEFIEAFAEETVEVSVPLEGKVSHEEINELKKTVKN